MHTQETLAIDKRTACEETVFSWLGALRSELSDHGVSVGIPRQLSHADYVAYRQELRCNDGTYALESKLIDEGSTVMRLTFLDADDKLVLSYRVHLGFGVDIDADTLSKRLREARKSIPLMAQYFDAARTTGTLKHLLVH